MDVSKNVFASAVAGLASFITIYPSEVIKNNYQFLKNKNQTYSSIIKNIYKTNGVTGFYRGMLPPLCLHSPRVATALSLNEYFKRYISTTPYSGYITGAMSGAVSGMFIATPGENIKVYSIHKNIPAIKSAKEMWKTVGVSAFKKGMSAIALKETFTYSGRLGTTEYFNKLLQPTNTLQVSLIGGIASAFITVIGTPFDVLVVRIQSDYTKKYKNIFNCAYIIIKEEGIQSLFRGALIRTVRTFFGMFVMFGIYDGLKKIL